MDDIYLSVNFNSSIDVETEFISCYAEFRLVDSLVDIVTDKETEIGSGSLYFINVFLNGNWSDIVYGADGISGDLYYVVEGLTDVIEEEAEFFGLLAILDRIHIDKE